ncbi:hypothetical protein C0993_006136 [Termitomyces sp. T159_Od127]|nr:hypothetical protein C0993_006136 [Termitomyces sp. T159_Od127]
MSVNKLGSEPKDKEEEVVEVPLEEGSILGAEEDADAVSILIDGEEYVTVNMYDNDYYSCDSNSEHLVTMTEAPEEE